MKPQDAADDNGDDLGLLVDAVAMRSLMDRYLRAAPGAPEIAACEVTFARRGEGRSFAQYRATLRDTATGEDRSQEITAVSYGAGRTADTWKGVLPSLPDAATATSPLAPAAYVPEVDVILQSFPFDHALPSLVQLVAGVCPPLESVLAQQFGPDGWRLAVWRTETLRYRATLRACLRLDVRAEEAGSNRTAERRFYAKVYASDADAERAWRVQRDLDRALREGPAGLRVPTPVAYLRDERILIQDEAAGVSLASLRRGEDQAAIRDGVRRAARALATLHQVEMASPGQRRKMPRVGAQRIHRAADRIRSTMPSLATLTGQAEAAVLIGLSALEDLPAVPVHGDFKPHHVLLSEDRVTLLDVDKFDAGEPMLDVTTMLRQIGQDRSLADLFAEEYFAQIAPAWQARLAPHYAAMLLQDAATLVRSTHAGKGKRSSGGASRAEALLRQAGAMLESGDWRAEIIA